MKISVQEISSVKKSIRIELSPELVSKELNHTLEHIQKEIRLPGFRPGKVPLSVLKKKFEGHIHDDLLRHVIDEYCPKGIDAAGCSSVVGSPEVHDIDFKLAGPISFTVTVDLLPTFKLSDYAGLGPFIPAQEILIAEDDVANGLKSLQQQQGYLEALPDDHSIALSDYATIDFAVDVEGKQVKGGRTTDYNLKVGSRAFYAEVEDALLGKRKGDKVSVGLMLPTDHPDTQFAGKSVLFKIEIKAVKAERLPPLDDELAKDIGLSSLDDLKERVKAALVAEKTNQLKQERKTILVDRLIDLHPIEAPEPMIAHEWKSLSKTEQVTEQSNPERYRLLQGRAVRRAKASVILSAIADEEKIEVLPQDIDNAIKQLSQRMGISFEQGKKDMAQDPNALKGLQVMLREEKALERVYSLSQCESVKEPVLC